MAEPSSPARDRTARGRPVALVHGWGGSYATTWAGSPLERSLHDARRPVVPVALPGHAPHGVSQRPEDYADIADQFRASLAGIDAADAVGYSLGGKLLLAVAAADPSRFRRLAIAGVGGNAFRPEEGGPIANALLAPEPARDTPPLLRRLVDEARATHHDRRALAAVLCRPPRPIRPDELAAVRAEVLLVCGTEDVVAGSVEPLARALPRCQVHLAEGLDHLDTPRSGELAARVLDFLA